MTEPDALIGQTVSHYHILEKLGAKYMSGANDEERNRKVRFLFSGMAGTLNVARLIVDTGQRKKFLEDARKFYFEAVKQ